MQNGTVTGMRAGRLVLAVGGTVVALAVGVLLTVGTGAQPARPPASAGTEAPTAPSSSPPGRATTAPSATSSQTRAIPPEQFPDSTTTGVPNGVELRRSGSVTITRRGTVIDGLDVHGSIEVQADDVTIRNTRVVTGEARYPIHVGPGVTGTLIEHVEVSNDGHDGKAIYFERSSGTVRFADVHSAEDGIFITGDDVLIEHSYVHHLVATGTSHSDAIQIRRGRGITIRENNLQAYNELLGEPMNAAIQIGSLVGDEPVTELRVVHNLMNGGSVTVNGGREGDLASAYFSDNRFGRDFRHDVTGNLPDTVVWEASNVFYDNGEPVA